jgi:hypothetical protein
MTANMHLFAFPVKLIVGLCIVFAGWSLRKRFSDTYMTVALVMMTAVALVQGFMPQEAGFTHSWPFVVVLTWFLTVLASRLFRKFSLAGLGLWLALWAGMLGSADSTVNHVLVPRDRYAPTSLSFEMRMEDFQVSRYDTGEPMEYRATISLRDLSEGMSVKAPDHDRPGGDVVKTLRVNHPVRYRGYQIYLRDYDVSRGNDTAYCIVMVTRQPWRWLVLAGILLLFGGALKIFIV